MNTINKTGFGYFEIEDSQTNKDIPKYAFSVTGISVETYETDVGERVASSPGVFEVNGIKYRSLMGQARDSTAFAKKLNRLRDYLEQHKDQLEELACE